MINDYYTIATKLYKSVAFSEFLTTKKFKDTPTGKKIQLANKLRDFLKSEHKS